MPKIPKHPDWIETYRLFVLYFIIMLFVFLLSI
jgi:hypothetical protein